MKRVATIDAWRGFVMILMALDHVRDMVMTPPPAMLDFSQAGAALFFTRWITHLCAPTFIMSAGVSAHLYGVRHPGTAALARFLVTRGLWLVVAELTIIMFAWNFNVGPKMFPALQVIWAIGWSMVALAGLVWLPRGVIAAIGAVMVLGHNGLDAVQPVAADASAIWHVLHIQGVLRVAGTPVGYVAYPLIPWVGVMALGYVLGPALTRPDRARPRWLVAIGAAMVAAFVVLRAGHFYGEPTPWVVRDTIEATVVGFLNVTKYPPSLQFLLMTLGVSTMILGGLERAAGRAVDVLATIGRVPFFYYVLHLYVIHALALIVGTLQGFRIADIAVMFVLYPPGFGVGLAATYGLWLAVVVALYPVCRWFAGVKARRTDWWLGYL